ncbi:hypothetical protein [Bacillus cereus]|uniref:Uncharacterized protein n=1 Tax=Bacillus cereus TaxID=1396 RepID=A0A9X8IY89_BACCE|nr:hypothetical protein [Bacillus cereus]RWQ72567.1 hypothetical protein DR116_0018510 [Bacillus cereus]
MSKTIEFAHGAPPKGFSEHLKNYFELVSIDAYMTPDFIDRSLPILFSEDDYVLVTAKRKEHVTYRELGRFELVDGIFSKGDYVHSFFIAKNIFNNKQTGKSVKLAALLYEERSKVHIWNPTFEELFLPLILDDLENDTDSHWRSLQEIHQFRSFDFDVYNIVECNDVDYEIVSIDNLCFNTTVFYSLLNHIFLIEDEKYPDIPGSNRTLKAYKDLYDDHLNDCVDMDKWRKAHHLKNPWKD